MADWYMEWAADHCHKFGIRDQDARMVLAWREVFELLFRPDELRSATAHLLGAADAPRFASDHRAAVIKAVEAVRRNAARKATESNVPRGCIECGGCGLVVVPHPGLTEDGDRWRQVLLLPTADPRGLTRTACVCCVLCSAGSRTREKTEADNRPLMTISQYEHLYPNWREVQYRRAEVLAAGRPQPSAEDVARLNQLLAAASEAAAKRRAAA